MRRLISFPIVLLNKGEQVANLQDALRFLEFEIADKEVEQSRFGKTTRQSVALFQRRQHLPITSQVDESTASRLNSVLERSKFFPERRRPLRGLRHLRHSVKDVRAIGGEAQAFVRETLNSELKVQILSAFHRPSQKLRKAVESLDLDYEALEDVPLKKVILETVAPALVEEPELEEEVQAHADRGLAVAEGTVGEILKLDRDIRANPAFASVLNRARNEALGKLAGLADDEVEVIDDLDLRAADRSALDRLIEHGHLRPEIRDDLASVVEFAKLTDDNFVAIDALIKEGARRPDDLISRDHADWTDFLERHDVEPPSGEDRGSFAKAIDINVQRAFRSAYLMERYARRERREAREQLADLELLRTRNATILMNGQVRKDLDWQGIAEADRPRVESSLRALGRFANTYRYLDVEDILNDRTLPLAERQARIERKGAILKTFADRNPHFDLAWANFVPLESDIARSFEPKWDGLNEAEQLQVRRSLTALQRVERLTATYEETAALLAARLDSASAIASTSESELVTRAALTPSVARRIRARAADTVIRAGHMLSAIADHTLHLPFMPGAVFEAADVPDLDVVNVLKEIDGYAELFGGQNFCRCQHCRSIFSPAAYFVSLMRFIDEHVSRSHFVEPGKSDHPLYLKNRRPDLWNLPLTCENTDTLIPYLAIVNEVLASYLERVFDEEDIFRALTTARLSFRQPSNLPFEELTLYLHHFGVDLAQIYELLGLPELEVGRVTLGLSPQEFATIATRNPAQVHHRYGRPDNLVALDTQALIRHAGVNREELDRLLECGFVRGNLAFEARIESPEDDLVGFVETLRLKFPAGQAVLNTQAEQLMRQFLDRLHRFVRLWRKLAWTPEELQLFIPEAQGLLPSDMVGREDAVSATLNESALVRMAALRRLQHALDKVPVEELFAFLVVIPEVATKPENPSLLARLFGGVTTLAIAHPALGNVDVDEPAVSAHFGTLQAALHVTEAELLRLILVTLPEETIAQAVFSIDDVSALYRRARLARLMDLGLEDLLASLDLLGLDLEDGDLDVRIATLASLVDVAATLKQTPFAVAEVAWLAEGGAAPAGVGTAPPESALRDTHQDIMNSGELAFRLEELARFTGLGLETSRLLLGDDEHGLLGLGWVQRLEGSEERYRLTSSIGPAPDLEALRVEIAAALHTENDEEALQTLAETVKAMLLEHHPLSLLQARMVRHLGISRDEHEALAPLRSIDLTVDDRLQQVLAWLNGEDPNPPKAVIDSLDELSRLVFVLKAKLRLATEALSFVAAHPDLFNLAVPVAWGWESLRLLHLYATRLPANPEDADALHSVLESWTGQTFPEEARVQLAGLLGRSEASVSMLLAHVQLPSNVFDAIAKIESAYEITSRLGLDGAAIAQLTAVSYEGLLAAKDIAYGAIRAKHEEGDWTRIAGPYQEQVHMLKRDLLVDRILSREFQLKFRDARAIYQFFLLDTEMDGCAKISRVKEAITACQLYFQRCLLSLEQSASGDVIVRVGSEAREQWEWRKSYRTQEANQRVFAYAENYLEPDLRDDKSHLFQDVEEQLLQETISNESLEHIYRKYLRDFGELAKLITVAAYHESPDNTYVFFGRTRQQPYHYYMRRLINREIWTAWQPLGIEISAQKITVTKHNKRLYIFWTNARNTEDSEWLLDAASMQREVADGLSDENQPSNSLRGAPVVVEYSYLTESGDWGQPQTVPFYLFEQRPGIANASPILTSDKVYADATYPDSLGKIRVIHPIFLHTQEAGYHQVIGYLNEYRTGLFTADGYKVVMTDKLEAAKLLPSARYKTSGLKLWTNEVQHEAGVWTSGDQFALAIQQGAATPYYTSEAAAERGLRVTSEGTGVVRLADIPSSLPRDIRVVHDNTVDQIAQLGDHELLIYKSGYPGYKKDLSNLLEVAAAIQNARRKSIRLTTSVADRLGERLFDKGLDVFLGLETQKTVEETIQSLGVRYNWLGELLPPTYGEYALLPQTHLDFAGPYGTYFREMFFHLPFLIANYLNAKQKFSEADHWYRRIFDPTAPQEGAKPSKNDKWRYIEFRSQNIPSLRSILGDHEAIEVYKTDPFNPFAIARLRPSAFQKAIVMKYIDNLLDWGDFLFSRDTFESINEALMLYTMAAEILGDRPVEVGQCDMVDDATLTYQKIEQQDGAASEFLIELENVIQSLPLISLNSRAIMAALPPGGTDDFLVPADGFAAVRDDGPTRLSDFGELRAALSPARISPTPTAMVTALVFDRDPTGPGPVAEFNAPSAAAFVATATAAKDRHLAFCLPPNEKLLGYWDRVEDRLFKIRNCMNIEGVRRELALWEPPIDPMLLVRARAAGLELEDVLTLLDAAPPPCRFKILAERARQLTATVQAFGSQLLNALERKDADELVLLRAVHEDELFDVVKKVKTRNRDEAKEARLALEEAKKLAVQRNAYYTGLLSDAVDAELAISREEQSHLTLLSQGHEKQQAAARRDKVASMHHAGPSWSASAAAGGGFSYTINGGPLATVSVNVAYGSDNIAAKETMSGHQNRKEAQAKDFEATKASLRGSYARRKAEWQQQRDLAAQEERQLDRQILAAEIREEAAEEELAAHVKQIAQSRELFNFYRDKFTNLGLYTFLSTALTRLYREAYNMAHEMAVTAQRAYRFEIGQDTFFVANDNWDAGRAGLLAGEKLLLQLQAMENSYLEHNRREYEITLPCSLMQINPEALIELQQTGSCAFRLPEIWLDLYYPGQYKRRIRSVRCTIPCVTGPYSNVSAKLTLTGSRMRTEPQAGSEHVMLVPEQRNASIVVSSANADAGLFELNFNDERYLPFEGAGAISDWQLELPARLRPFDYDTITDVILHVSFTARYDGRFKQEVEDGLAAQFSAAARDNGLLCAISLKHEFPSEYHRLLNGIDGQPSTAAVKLDRRYFPYFLNGHDLTLRQARIVLQPPAGRAIEPGDLPPLGLNGGNGSGWAAVDNVNIVEASFALNDQALTTTGVVLELAKSDGELPPLDDFWLLIEYDIVIS